MPTQSVIEAPHGVITTPEFPGFYPNNANMAWLVRVDHGSINLVFTDFDLEPGNGSNCSNDSLEVSNQHNVHLQYST